MRKHALYAYVEGHDLDSVVGSITDRLSCLVNDRDWISGEAWVVNQMRGDPTSNGGWELGMNLDLPDPHQEPEGWFSDIEEIAITCNELAAIHHRSFFWASLIKQPRWPMIFFTSMEEQSTSRG